MLPDDMMYAIVSWLCGFAFVVRGAVAINVNMFPVFVTVYIVVVETFIYAF